MIEYLQQKDSFCMTKSNFDRRWKMRFEQSSGAASRTPPEKGDAHTGMKDAHIGREGARTGRLY